MSTYAQENITYWTRRAPSYSDVNQEELGGSQHSVWSRVIDSGFSPISGTGAETRFVCWMWERAPDFLLLSWRNWVIR